MSTFNEFVEVTFRFDEDMPWMKVSMEPPDYAMTLNGIPFRGLTMKNILTESFEDLEGNAVHMIFDTFNKTWFTEYHDVESTSL